MIYPVILQKMLQPWGELTAICSSQAIAVITSRPPITCLWCKSIWLPIGHGWAGGNEKGQVVGRAARAQPLTQQRLPPSILPLSLPTAPLITRLLRPESAALCYVWRSRCCWKDKVLSQQLSPEISLLLKTGFLPVGFNVILIVKHRLTSHS